MQLRAALNIPCDLQEAALGLTGAKSHEREAIYNTEGIHDKLEEIAWTDEVAWVETQALTCGETEQLEDVEDDLQRELAFYNQVRITSLLMSSYPQTRKLSCLPAAPACPLLLCLAYCSHLIRFL